jgi:hypothetical protein
MGLTELDSVMKGIIAGEHSRDSGGRWRDNGASRARQYDPGKRTESCRLKQKMTALDTPVLGKDHKQYINQQDFSGVPEPI